ncbi:50S ribosomal protein L5 [Botrimarina colliarenosi]|uniref:Large ribosomal subunit protein uL5 n=1 Tax=Botrimarina colliarenosi TaxID=2528001 RepID=A0A5C6AB78_9BACT|nr:50S ribosomal protein L5 [Botrimarina colliarenosi]TWT96660.1 50S ribosomal protein L5 [Botrimarina colliarenosi]
MIATARLKDRYESEILPQLTEELGRKNRLSLPRLEKIVVSMGVGSAISDKKHIDEATSALADITGQKAQVCKSRKSIAGFRLREGMPIGAKVTLRGVRMYEFLDRLISIALPRVRDFRGVKKTAFDGSGNYSLGLTEQLVFPELNPDKYTRPQGMNIAICTRGATNEEAQLLLEKFGFPFKREED